MTSETLHLCVRSLLVPRKLPPENAPPLDFCSDVRRKAREVLLNQPLPRTYSV